MGKWKVIKSVKDIVNPGIFQEKIVVVCNNEGEVSFLKKGIEDKNPEYCEVPTDIKEKYPHSFAFWANKHDSKCTPRDIAKGIRMKIN